MNAPTPNAELAYPTWLDIATAAFGEPKIAFPEPIRTGRRCWAWFVDGQNFHLAFDVENGRVRTWAGSPGRRADLFGSQDPDDADVRALCSFVWPGFAEAAEALGRELSFGTGCRCDYLGKGTPEHTPSPLCRSLRPDAERTEDGAK